MNPECLSNHNKQDFRDACLTKRGLSEYMDIFDITDDEMDDPNMTMLDLGSGLKQEFARQAKEEGYKSKIISVDPRLGLSLEEDLSLLSRHSPREIGRISERISARQNLPDNSLSAIAQALPFKDKSFDRVFALWSVPYYIITTPEEIKIVLKEMLRVVKDGGVIKAHPLPMGNKFLSAAKDFLSEQSDIEFSIDKNKDMMIINKKEKTVE
ncbi:MAG: hypothetical protein COU29_00360 [Candidatus Magasanikbacteria bacterium CG10_big_fil_rev_8_21_14_0_10_36_32]|uniref:Methyltransferase type 11 domain-containing protein n=1 Tax=Candidatus Magasanikbacteria bacterium CG10_big_fil_rev_8_21_14_0_10_36_32 TaxID=1974646 RepID=A0A2M6W7R6_9BACT|nr:MAG: hypothetical protein COU29_00360 [Candidatus Magasanikbacteria bacterium CG10_big_fil_rev_8_21_14_0_10_36_32]